MIVAQSVGAVATAALIVLGFTVAAVTAVLVVHWWKDGDR